MIWEGEQRGEYLASLAALYAVVPAWAHSAQCVCVPDPAAQKLEPVCCMRERVRRASEWHGARSWAVMVVVRSSGAGAWRSAKKGGESGRHLHMFLGCF